MSKVQSGGLLIAIAVLLNIGGRFLPLGARDSQSAGSATFLAILMFASVVVGLFGLYRLISGLVGKKP